MRKCKNSDSFYRNFESKPENSNVDGRRPGPVESDLECQRVPIFARCAAASVVVVVDACALARGGC